MLWCVALLSGCKARTKEGDDESDPNIVNGTIKPIEPDNTQQDSNVDSSSEEEKSANTDQPSELEFDTGSDISSDAEIDIPKEPELIQETWPYFYRDEAGKELTQLGYRPEGWKYQVKDRTSDAGNLHCGYDIVIDYHANGEPQNKVRICNVVKGKLIDKNFDIKAGYGGNGGRGNYVVVESEVPIYYIDYDKSDATGNIVKSNPKQGYDILTVRYLHMQPDTTFSASLGATIDVGDFLGYVGNTGASYQAHLHIDINNAKKQNNLNTDLDSTIDPIQFFPSLTK